MCFTLNSPSVRVAWTASFKPGSYPTKHYAKYLPPNSFALVAAHVSNDFFFLSSTGTRSGPPSLVIFEELTLDGFRLPAPPDASHGSWSRQAMQ